MENHGEPEVRREIRRAISALQLAQEILAGLTGSEEGSTEALLGERASVLGARLTRAELDPEERAEERGD